MRYTTLNEINNPNDTIINNLKERCSDGKTLLIAYLKVDISNLGNVMDGK